MVKILLVDDEKSIRVTFNIFLEKEGYYVVVAGDAISTLNIFDQHDTFDLIITEEIMPQISDLELLSIIRERK